MVIRRAGTPSARSVPARSSSSMLLAGKRARPKPASTMRFCAVRLKGGERLASACIAEPVRHEA